MRLTSIVRLKMRSLFSRKAVEEELEEELQYHLERQIEQEIAAGKSSKEAHHAALRAIRDLEQRKEECRDARGVNFLDQGLQDFRYALRQLRKNPGFACTAILVLALGISGAVAIFGFVNAALIQPLPYRDQSRLVAVFESSPGQARSMLSYLDFADWKRLNVVFRSIEAFALNGGFTLRTANGAEQVTGTRVSAGFFRTLGVRPLLGRDFRAGEDSPGAARPVMLSYDAWQRRFGGRRDVLGQTITLNGTPNTVIGVLPREFHFAPYGRAEFWGTLRADDSCERQRQCHNLMTIARLKPGVSIERASVNMRAIARQLRSEYPDTNRDFGSADLVSLRDVVIGDVRPILLVSLSGAGLLLLIACVNVTTLLLARCDRRRREIAVRGALGASLSRLLQQFANEGSVLSGLSGGLGLLFAEGGMRLVRFLVPAAMIDSMPYLEGIGLTLPVILFGGCLWLFAGLLLSLVPMARLSAPEMTEGLKEGARGTTGRMWRVLGANLVVAEVAIAMVLLVGAGLLGKSLYLLLHADIGFNANRLAVVHTSWDQARYTSDPQKIVLERRIVQEISKLPGVESAAVSTASPIDSGWGMASFHILGRPNRGEHNIVLNRQVSSAYFTTLQARLLRGRYFRDDEDLSKPLVAIVNRTLAAKYFAGQDALGKEIYYDDTPQSRMQIVGIVADIKEGPLEGANLPALYVPYNQNPAPWPAVLVRTAQQGNALLPEIGRAIHNVDPFISVFEEQTMTERIDDSPAAYLHRSSAVLVGVFAAAAFLLSLAGLYGVVAYSVSQRTREIGIRMALGAERTMVYRLILREAGWLAVAGVALGVALSLTAAGLMRALLFGVRSWDVPTLLSAAVVLAASAILASYIPARRAASVDPVEALRLE